MKQFLKKFLSITLLLSSAAAFADCGTTSCETSCNSSTNCSTVACFPNRSQSRYKIHQDAGMVGHTNDVSSDDVEGWWGTASATVGYQQTFKSSKIAKSLLGSDFVSSSTPAVTSCNDSCGNNVIKIQGSTVASRDAKAWLADNFYLPTDFNGSFSISPKIQTFFADLDFYLGLDEWWKGGYVQFSGPIVYTRWNLDYQEQTPTAAGTTSYAAGYFTPDALVRANMLTNFSEYVQGKSPISGAGTITQTGVATAVPATNTITFQPLNYARMRCDASKETGFADLRMELGWNFWKQDDYHLGINIQGAAPTGNKCCSKYVFDAVVGNGKHWELGGGLTGHYAFYRSEDGEKHFGFYGDLNVTHMFGRSGLHTYDLKNKPNSKYMLAAQFGANNLNVRGTNATGTVATQQFAQNYAPVANLTTVNVNVSSAAQIDMIAKFNYTYKNFSFDLGYNFFYRSCQDVDCSTSCDSDCGDALVNLCSAGQENTWALKGDAQMYGFAITGGTTTANAPVVVATQVVPLSATESTANIHGGTNGTNGTIASFPITNANIDNAQVAFAGGATSLALTNTPAGLGTAINTSIQPKFLSCSDIDMNGTQSMSNTLFGHIQYNFKGDDWTPYLGLGAMVEFGTHSSDCDSSDDCSDNNCSTATASYWGVWVKGGISFS